MRISATFMLAVLMSFGMRALAEQVNYVVIRVEQSRTQKYHRDALMVYVNGKLAHRGREGKLGKATVRVALSPKRLSVRPEAPYALVHVGSIFGLYALTLEVRGKAGQRLTWMVMPPSNWRIVSFWLRDWERGFDSAKLQRTDDGQIMRVVTEVMNGIDRCTIFLAPKRAPAMRKRAFRIATRDGFAISLSRDGTIHSIELRGAHCELSGAVGGVFVGDALSNVMIPVRGDVRRDGDALVQNATLHDAGLTARIRYVPRANRIEVDGVFENLRGGDRGLDIAFALPLRLTKWKFHYDITQSVALRDGVYREQDAFPVCAVTHANGERGLAIAIPPDAPCNFAFRAIGDATLALHLRMGTSDRCMGELKNRAPFRFVLYSIDGVWGYRDALRHYYAMFPSAFKRRARKEGLWLFACKADRLPNPQDYAYHEGTAADGEIDEKLGLLTFPYIIAGQRQILLPNLPKDYDEAVAILKRIDVMLPDAWRVWGSGQLDDSVARTGMMSLRLSRDEGDVTARASQRIVLNQEAPRPFTVIAWSKAEGITGKRDNNYSLWLDIRFTDGTFLYGQAMAFDVGTHDWQRVAVSIKPTKPVAWVNVNLLLRGDHTGTAWFDDVKIVGDGAIENGSFEQIAGMQLRQLIERCALMRSDGGYYIVIRDHVGADIKPKRPIPMVVFSVNCDPNLYRDSDVPTIAKMLFERVRYMVMRYSKIDGIYVDSTSGWCGRHLNFRREHFRYVRIPLTYDRRTGRVAIDGKFSVYEFLRALGEILHPQGRLVFANIGDGMRHVWIYFAVDVCGIEGGGRPKGEVQLNFYRTAAYQKPVLLLHYFTIWGRQTQYATRDGFEDYVKRATLYGMHPAIGRLCVEAYEKFGDVFRTYMPVIRTISAAGWEPVTHARANDPIVRIERFGNVKRGRVYFTIYNASDKPVNATVQFDTDALGISASHDGRDMISGRTIAIRAGRARLQLASEELMVLATAKVRK